MNAGTEVGPLADTFPVGTRFRYRHKHSLWEVVKTVKRGVVVELVYPGWNVRHGHQHFVTWNELKETERPNVRVSDSPGETSANT